MAKNVVVTVDDYLMRKDPEKYKKMLEPKEEEAVVVTKVENDTEKRELLAEIQERGVEIGQLQDSLAASNRKIKKLEAENKKLKKIK